MIRDIALIGVDTDGVGRQYIGEIGKTDNGVVLLTTYLHDGVRRLPLDVALYQYASSLEQGKADPNFQKKPDLALDLVDQCLKRGYRPGVTVIDAGYGNNTPNLCAVGVEKPNLRGSNRQKPPSYCSNIR